MKLRSFIYEIGTIFIFFQSSESSFNEAIIEI